MLERPELEIGTVGLGDHAGVAIVGEPGVGKTHLAGRLSALVDSDTIWLTGVPQRRDIPLGALEALLEELAGQEYSAVGAEGLLGRRLQERPGAETLLRVEDAQWLDETSAAVIAGLCRTGIARLIVTARASEPIPEPIVRLWRDGVIARVDLLPFDAAESTALIERALGGELLVDTATAFFRATGGNALQLREAVGDALESGALVRSDGVWQLVGGARPGRRIAQIVDSELRQLSDHELRLVQLVALAGAVSLPVIERCGMLDALDSVAPTALLDIGAVGRGRNAHHELPAVRITHSLFAEAIRRATPLRRRRELFDLSGLASPAQHPGPETPLRLMRTVAWALDCGLEVDVDRLLAAAAAALQLSDFEYPIQVSAAALDQLADGDQRRVDAHLLRSEAFRWSGEPSRARRELVRAAELVDADVADVATTGSAARRVGQLAKLTADLDQYSDDRPADALTVLADARRRVEELGRYDTAVDDTLAMMRIEELSHRLWGGPDDETLSDALAAADDVALPLPRRLAVISPIALSLCTRGRFDEALRLTERFVDEARAHAADQSWATFEILSARYHAHVLRGDVAEATAMIGLDVTEGDILVKTDLAMECFGRGTFGLITGRWAYAAEHYRAATTRFRVSDVSGFLVWSLAREALARAWMGEATTARQLRDEAAVTPLRVARWAEHDIRHTACVVAALVGEAGAAAQAVTHAEWCDERRLPYAELLARHLAAAVGGPVVATSQLPLAETIAPLVDGPLPPLVVAHVAAIANGDAEVATAGAAALAARGIFLPVVVRVTGLSKREHQVATLASQGLTSAEIAERLFVSVRTVDTHLGRVFTKLAIRRRGDLAAALARTD